MKKLLTLSGVAAVMLLSAAQAGYSDEFKESFKKECEKGESKAYCECALTEFEQRVDEKRLTEFYKAEDRASQDKLNDLLNAVQTRCTAKVK